MPINEQLGVLFVHIPRTGGHSIETALNLTQDRRLFGTRELNGTSVDAQHLTAKVIRKLYPGEWESMTTFSFVRNPWDRYVSLYHYAKQKRPDLCTAWNISSQTTFAEFIRFVGDSELFIAKPQCVYLCDEHGDILTDFVGRFESYAHDFATVCAMIGLPISTPNISNTTDHAHYSSYYCDETIEIVRRLAHDDIDIFSYSFSVQPVSPS